jgi:hypothetical protein
MSPLLLLLVGSGSGGGGGAAATALFCAFVIFFSFSPLFSFCVGGPRPPYFLFFFLSSVFDNVTCLVFPPSLPPLPPSFSFFFI